jgi:hypothetical protein
MSCEIASANGRDFLGLYSFNIHNMRDPKVIDKLAEKYQTSVENIIHVYDITSRLNSFLESEVLVPHAELGFMEDVGYMRRGIKDNAFDSDEHLEDKPAKAFIRKMWPTGNYDLQTSRVDGLVWYLTYEVGPDYNSTGMIVMGYNLDHETHNKAPLYWGVNYKFAVKNKQIFQKTDQLIDFLRDYISKLDIKTSL